MSGLPALKFVYRNYKDEIEERVVDLDDGPVGRFEYWHPGINPQHPLGGWMVSGICRVRKARRTFELKRIIGPIEEVF